jgi:allophanate hydrolase
VTGFPPGIRIGVPRKGQLKFFGDTMSEQGYDAAVTRLTALGAVPVEFDLTPFYETAQLLYDGPWVAERYLVIRDLLANNPEAVHPVTREITLKGKTITAADTFAALYKLEAMRQISRKTFETIDAMVLPTAPTAYTVDEVLANPIELNSRNGTYTNFVNLLDMCGLAIPAAMRPDGIPFGITLLAPAGQDAKLASIGRVFHADTKLKTGAKGVAQPPLTPVSHQPGKDEVAILAVGAHLSGMALNHELLSLGGRLIEATSTAPDYKLYALKGTVPPKPGMLRVAPGAGSAIAVEVWALPTKAFGAFVAAIPSPLSIGTVNLADGSSVKGFLVEASATEGARDITSFGGWRAFIAAQTKSA